MDFYLFLFQILDMTDNETEMLATHLGHDPKTHKENYRLTHSTRELSLVSVFIKLFCLFNNIHSQLYFDEY